MDDKSPGLLLQAVKEIILQSRQKVFRYANRTLLESYWHIGKLIVEEEQKGNFVLHMEKEYSKHLPTSFSLNLAKVMIIRI